METEQNEPGMVRPWLLVVLVFVVLAGIGFFSWNYMQIKKTDINIPFIDSPRPDTAILVPAATPTVSPSPISTADWKTYSDTTNGFSIKYPNNWTISHDVTPYATCPNTVNTVPPVGITLTNPDVFKTAQGGAWEDMNESFRINIYNSVSDASCGFTTNYSELLNRNIFIDKATQITVGGVNATKGNFIAGNGGLPAVYLQKDNKVYEFIPYKETGDMTGSSVVTTSNQILSNLQFTK